MSRRTNRPRVGYRHARRGFSLIMVLLMLFVLSTLAVGAMNTSLLQERMAGNSRDKNVALQSAEAALRDAEADIVGNLSAASPFVSTCDNGLCVPPSMTATGATSTPAWQTIAWDRAHTRSYGQYTGATALPEVARQPLYIVELLPSLPPGVGDSVNLGNQATPQPQAFRITARAFGLRASTTALLQSVYVTQ